MLNLTFPTMYKKIAEMYEKEAGYTDEIIYSITERIYIWELMTLFNLTEFNEQVINNEILSLYELLKDNEIVRNVLDNFNYDDIISFITLFSYDYFYLFYPILKGEDSDILEKMAEIELSSSSVYI